MTLQNFVAGIDPGLNGAICIISRKRSGLMQIERCIDIPTMGEDTQRRVKASEVIRFLREHHQPQQVFIELAQAMPDDAAARAFRYGRAVGALEAAVLGCGIPLIPVSPVSWKRAHNLTGKDKAASRALANLTFPGSGFFNRAKDGHRAEAALIAVYGLLR